MDGLASLCKTNYQTTAPPFVFWIRFKNRTPQKRFFYLRDGEVVVHSFFICVLREKVILRLNTGGNPVQSNHTADYNEF